MKSPDTTAKLTQILAHPGLKHASVGVLIRAQVPNQAIGQTLFARNPDLALMPASNMKIITAIAVLAQKGVAYTFPTELYATPPNSPNSPNMLGDIYLKGSGDPSLGAKELETLVNTLKRQGITQITGKFIADASCFSGPSRGEGWEWDDEAAYYAAPVSGLNCDENTVEISVSGQEILLGGKYPLAVGDFIQLRNTVETVFGKESKEKKVVFDRVHGENIFTLSGTIGSAASPQVDALTIEDPALFTLYRFALLCRAGGIAVPDAPLFELGKVPVNAKKLAESRSEPLEKLVKTFLKDSDNLYGECFLRSLIPAGDIMNGEKYVIALLKRASIDIGGLNIADGSGLSRHNTVTARLLVDALTKVPVLLSPAAQRAFLEALPLGGVDGTLKNRFKNTKAAGNVRAKTGTLTGASSLSGYVTDTQKKRWVFSILLNHYDKEKGASLARSIQDQIVMVLAG
jgi:serine-type D-Ala-D-Ala carboxypeptidase/endopeptidase (penicillin-binding protein 4)